MGLCRTQRLATSVTAVKSARRSARKVTSQSCPIPPAAVRTTWQQERQPTGSSASTAGTWGRRRADRPRTSTGASPSRSSSCPERCAVRRRPLDRRNPRRLPLCSRGRDSRLSQRVRRAGVDAAALRTRCPPRGLLRDAGRRGSPGSDDGGGPRGVLPPPRHLLGRLLTGIVARPGGYPAVRRPVDVCSSGIQFRRPVSHSTVWRRQRSGWTPIPVIG